MQKLTKIVATIGPATDSEEQIEKIIDMGVNVIRFNFKHSDVPWHEERINRVKMVAERKGVYLATLLDLQGPEVRLRINHDGIDVTEGGKIRFLPVLNGEETDAVTVTQPEIIEHLTDGQIVLSDDGTFRFRIEHDGDQVVLVSLQNGFLKNKKTLNLPGANIPLDVLSDRDYEGLDMAKRCEVDFVALSFVRNKEDLTTLRTEMAKRDLKSAIIAKIENQHAIDNLDEIIMASDGAMVARGDMGVELPFEEVPYYTRLIIGKCVELGKPVITATQMLESMIEHPFPTRAEVSDVATATYAFSDAVMLSGESANGKYPLEAINVMAKTVSFNEVRQFTDTRTHFQFELNTQTEILCGSAYDLYQTIRTHTDETLAGFIVFTYTGLSARMISKFRPRLPIFAICPSANVARALSLTFGVYPHVYYNKDLHESKVEHDEILNGIQILSEKGWIENGRKYIVIYGDFWAVAGGSSTIKIVTA